jgi:hypothetical protein
MEAGDPGISIGAWTKALWALGLINQMEAVAHPDTDLMGKSLELSRLPKAVRASSSDLQLNNDF